MLSLFVFFYEPKAEEFEVFNLLTFSVSFLLKKSYKLGLECKLFQIPHMQRLRVCVFCAREQREVMQSSGFSAVAAYCHYKMCVREFNDVAK